VKIVNSKKSTQMIVCYFIANTLAFVEQSCFHHSKTWCCPKPQNFIVIQNTGYKVFNTTYEIEYNRNGKVSDTYVSNTYDLKNTACQWGRMTTNRHWWIEVCERMSIDERGWIVKTE
jgi:hypothetical protein